MRALPCLTQPPYPHAMATTRSAGPPPLRDALAAVNDRIADAAARSGRSRDHVALIAVTKYASPDQIRQVVELGQADLGESRVQQLAQRVPQLREFLSRKKTLSGAGSKPDEQTPDAVRWHMIGQLQRNKVKQCVPHVDLIHSVDSLRLAEELHNYGAKTDTVIDVLIQVNATGGPGGPGKGGVAAPAVVHLIEQIDTMLHLRPRGLMTMAPFPRRGCRARPRGRPPRLRPRRRDLRGRPLLRIRRRGLQPLVHGHERRLRGRHRRRLQRRPRRPGAVRRRGIVKQLSKYPRSRGFPSGAGFQPAVGPQGQVRAPRLRAAPERQARCLPH